MLPSYVAMLDALCVSLRASTLTYPGFLQETAEGQEGTFTEKPRRIRATAALARSATTPTAAPPPEPRRAGPTARLRDRGSAGANSCRRELSRAPQRRGSDARPERWCPSPASRASSQLRRASTTKEGPGGLCRAGTILRLPG